MLAKLIAVAPSRAAAARRLAAALSGARIHGVSTNRDLLVRVLREPDFLAGYLDTGYLDSHEVSEPLIGRSDVDDFALAAALADAAEAKAAGAVQPAVPIGWRNVASQRPRRSYTWGERHIEQHYDAADPRVVRFGPDEVVLRTGAGEMRFAVARYGELRCVDSPQGSVTLRALPRFAAARPESAAGSLIAPLPGAVTEIVVRRGERVHAGAALLVLEAMKMRHPILAPHDGVVGELRVAVHDQVQAGEVLATVEPADDE
jgi:propionyl-CoA carboxylase alpha chain